MITSIQPKKFSSYVDLLLGFVKTESSVALLKESELGYSIESISILHDSIQSLFGQKDKNWKYHFSPLFSALVTCCKNANLRIRQKSLDVLMKTIYSPQHIESGTRLSLLFSEVLFPCLASLSEESRNTSFDELKIRLCSLVTRSFLQYCQEMDDSHVVWKGVLDWLVVYYQKGDEFVRESVLESLKNCLLVLGASEYDKAFWESTWSTITPTFPTIREDLFPSEKTESTAEILECKIVVDQKKEIVPTVDQKIVESVSLSENGSMTV